MEGLRSVVSWLRHIDRARTQLQEVITSTGTGTFMADLEKGLVVKAGGCELTCSAEQNATPMLIPEIQERRAGSSDEKILGI